MSEYISNSLAHFVGRSLQDDEARYNLLKKIVDTGILTSCPSDPMRQPKSIVGSSGPAINEYGEITKNENYVCFCDIPDDCLERHTKNYSKFGLGFLKMDIVNNGGRPVQYIPLQAKMHPYNNDMNYPPDPTTYFALLQEDMSFFMQFLSISLLATPVKLQTLKAINNKGEQAQKVILQLLPRKYLMKLINPNDDLYKDFLPFITSIYNFLPFLKFYDETLTQSDPNNFYYEREWRLLGFMRFSLNDLMKVYLPISFKDRFIAEYPDYSGQFVCL